jgi:HTH-type transcriptional regulator / antitoxin HipB
MDKLISLADIIKFHRKKSGLSQKELADLAGAGKTVVFDLEKGKTSVQYDIIQKILNVLNVKIVYESPIINLMEKRDEKN